MYSINTTVLIVLNYSHKAVWEIKTTMKILVVGKQRNKFLTRFARGSQCTWVLNNVQKQNHTARTVQVNLCQKLLFLHQLTHNMTTDCSLNYKFNTWKFQAQTCGEHVVRRNCFRHSEQFLYTTCFAKRRASDKDSPIKHMLYVFICPLNTALTLAVSRFSMNKFTCRPLSN